MRGGRKEFDNNMRIVLFENENKRRGKKDPDMRGSLEIDGEKYWVDVWWNESDKKGEYLSGKLNPMEEQSPQQRNKSRVSRRNDDDDFDRDDKRRRAAPERSSRGRSNDDDDMDDDIPF